MNEPATDTAAEAATGTATATAPCASGPAASTGTWLVYLLECADGTLYCGITTNMDRRLHQHNGQIAGGARYTRGRRPVRLLSCRACGCKSEALRLEKAVKTRARSHKQQFLLSGEVV